jgi:hypothetical protein
LEPIPAVSDEKPLKVTEKLEVSADSSKNEKDKPKNVSPTPSFGNPAGKEKATETFSSEPPKTDNYSPVPDYPTPSFANGEDITTETMSSEPPKTDNYSPVPNSEKTTLVSSDSDVQPDIGNLFVLTL